MVAEPDLLATAAAPALAAVGRALARLGAALTFALRPTRRAVTFRIALWTLARLLSRLLARLGAPLGLAISAARRLAGLGTLGAPVARSPLGPLAAGTRLRPLVAIGPALAA